MSECTRWPPCVRAVLTQVPCWLPSAFLSRLGVSRYGRLPPWEGFGHLGSHMHTHTTQTHKFTGTHASPHTHMCPLSSPSLFVFLLPRADCVFAGDRWADIDSLLNNKNTLRLSLRLSLTSLSASLPVHLDVLTFYLPCNPLVC